MRLALGMRNASLVLAVFLAVPACKTNKVEIPDFTGPSVAVTTVPLVTKPGAAPTPTPAPAPSPGATPDPAPTPPARSASCNLPAGPGNGDDCERTGETFLANIDSAIETVIKTKPKAFRFDDVRCPNCFKVVDLDAFISGLMDALAAQGVCAHDDGEEIAIKSSNEFNDQFDVLTADFYLRRGEGSYRSTCRPASF